MSMNGWQMMRSLTRDSSVAQRKLAPGTARRVVGYASPYRRQIIVFLVLVVIDAALVVAPPLLLGQIIDRGVTPGDSGVVVRLSLLVAALAVLDGVMTLVQRWYSSRIGEGLIFDLRTQVFAHVLRQPIAFFTRAQTGALVSRLNNDVIGAQQAFTSTLSGVVSNVIGVVVIVIAMALAVLAADPGGARAAAVLPRARPPDGAPARRPHARVDGAQRRARHPHDRALQRRRRPAGQALRPARHRGPAVRRAGRQGPRHRRQDRPQPHGLLRRPHHGRLPRDRHGLRRRRGDGRQRHADRGHAARAGGPARPALRPAHGPVQRADRRDDGAGLLRARLRGARPEAAGQGGGCAGGHPAPSAHGGLRRGRLQLPVGRRGLARLAGDGRLRRPRRGGAGAARRDLPRPRR